MMRAFLAIGGYVLVALGLSLALDEFVFRPQRRAMPLLDEDRLPIVPVPPVFERDDSTGGHAA